MSPENRKLVASLGPDLSMDMIQGSMKAMAVSLKPADPEVIVTRDHFYGQDERHRLDLFRKPGMSGAPVLVFLHGGGFVRGDKHTPGTPFYDNFGHWAASKGWLGVTMTYRLAPQHPWPSGPQDTALAVEWLRNNASEFGGNGDAIILVGQSAGAVHTAAYVAHSRFHGADGPGIAGAVMVSGVYDATTYPQDEFGEAYYGKGGAMLQEANHLPGLIKSTIPLAFSVSEFDPAGFQAQAAQLVAEWIEAKGDFAPVHYLAGHNHMTPVPAIGGSEDDLGPLIEDFVFATLGD